MWIHLNSAWKFRGSRGSTKITQSFYVDPQGLFVGWSHFKHKTTLFIKISISWNLCGPHYKPGASLPVRMRHN